MPWFRVSGGSHGVRLSDMCDDGEITGQGPGWVSEKRCDARLLGRCEEVGGSLFLEAPDRVA